MRLDDVRKRYIDFFKARGHVHIPSAPIVPGNDPTTLFTSSGMQPLLPYFLGKDHPEGKRVVDSQLSFRAGDIEEVGDNRHTTFFEMLGNWSFGDYFKKEQLPWIFEFLTDKEFGLGLDASKLYVTVYAGDETARMPLDEEAVTLWKDIFDSRGLSSGFSNIGSEEAGYEKGMREGERIFAYDSKKNWWSRSGVPANMPSGEPGGPDSELFFDFGTPHNTSFGEQCHPNCDCGRFVEIGNSVFMQYVKNADGSFSPLPKQNVDFGGGLERLTWATLGTGDIFDLDVFKEARMLFEKESPALYTENEETRKSVRIILDHIRASTMILGERVAPQSTEAGYILRRLLRRSIRELDKLSLITVTLPDLAKTFIDYYGTTYEHVRTQQDFIMEELQKEEERFRKTLVTGLKEFQKAKDAHSLSAETVFTLYSTYGFPLELTQELLKENNLTVPMDEVKKRIDEHQATSRAGAEGKFAGGLADHSVQTIAYHTAHHLLLKALQTVLGSHVHQRGSNITSERLRIDFSHDAKVTREQLEEVEKIVNATIEADLPVVRTDMKREDAEKLGAEMEFGVKYPDMVSVYSVGPLSSAYSIEFCGGPHVEHTGQIAPDGKKFRIKKEEASSAGVRRIKAVVE